MAKLKNELAVGIFFFVSMLILGYFTVIMKEDLWDSKEYYRVKIFFPAIFGLEEGDKVKILGVDSGQVESISLENNKVYVTLKMYNNFRLFENYAIKIRSQSVLGGKYVSIYPGSEIQGDKIYSVLDQQKVLLTGVESGDLVGMLEDIVAENRVAINETMRNMRDITKELRIVAQKINSGDGTISKLINTDTIHDNADDLIKELRESVEDAREQAPITSFIRAAITAL